MGAPLAQTVLGPVFLVCVFFMLPRVSGQSLRPLMHVCPFFPLNSKASNGVWHPDGALSAPVHVGRSHSSLFALREDSRLLCML